MSHRNQRNDGHQKRAAIDLDNTEGVFSRQGFFFLYFYFSLIYFGEFRTFNSRTICRSTSSTYDK